MSAAMKSMNLEKISTLMDNFEKEFEVNVSGENTNDILIYWWLYVTPDSDVDTNVYRTWTYKPLWWREPWAKQQQPTFLRWFEYYARKSYDNIWNETLNPPLQGLLVCFSLFTVQDAVEGLMKQAADEVDKQNVFNPPALFAKMIAQTCHCDIVSKFSIPGRSWAQHGASRSTKCHHRTINSGKTWWWGTCNSELYICQRAFQWT